MTVYFQSIGGKNTCSLTILKINNTKRISLLFLLRSPHAVEPKNGAYTEEREKLGPGNTFTFLCAGNSVSLNSGHISFFG